MNDAAKRFAIALLRWTLGVVVVLESVPFLFSTQAIHQFEQSGLPQWIRPVLGGSEIIAAVLFLAPPTTLLGGYLLLGTFAAAIVVHVLHGQYDVLSLIVYCAVVIVCVAQRKPEAVTP